MNPQPTPIVQNKSATYYSEDDLRSIRSHPVRVIVSFVLDLLADNGINYRAKIRNPKRVQVIKIRSIDTSSEIAIIVPSDDPKKFSVRFHEHTDRYCTTTPSRIVIRKVDFDCDSVDAKSLENFMTTHVLKWLTPRVDNLKPAPVHMLVLEDTPVCPSPLVAIGFVVEHASITTENGNLVATISNKGRHITRVNRRVPDIVADNTRETLIGRIYVEFFNGEYLFMSERIFEQQFSFFREGMIDTSVKH